MRMGRMDRLVTLKLRTATGQDAYGEETESWEEIPIWAERREWKGTERYIAQQHLATLDGRYLIHFREDVTTQDLLIDDEKTFDIHAVIPLGFRAGLELLVATAG